MTIEEKINALPSEAKKEILDFVEFLIEKNRKGSKEDKEWHLKLSEKSLDKIWNNPEDDIYSELL
ncbi:MAG: DUF2281 domain-containing protein [Spirochaetota bacterium]